MILTFIAGCKKIDVMVKPEQRIYEVYQRLLKTGFFSPVEGSGQLTVYSMRQKSYVNFLLTFWQGGIYTGDILRFQ